MRRLVLGIETGGEHLSAALLEEGPTALRLLAESVVHRGSRHADLALTLVSEVLARAGVGAFDVSLVAVGRGPGGFTGVRLGLSIAQGLSLASGVPVWPVSSLATLSLNATATGLPVLAMIDAKKGEVYAGLFRLAPGAPPITLLAPCVTTCEAALVAAREAALAAAREAAGLEGMIVLGSGALAYGVASPLPAPAHVATASRTAELALLEWAEAGWDAQRAPAVDPVYLRRSEAEILADARDGISAGAG